MSFGFSIDDTTLLAQLTTRAYNEWKKTCGEYANVTGSLEALEKLLARIEAEALAPNSIFTKSSEDLWGWKTVLTDCRSVVNKLETIISNDKNLGTSRRRNWDRLRKAFKNLDDVNRDLIEKTTSISAYFSVIGLSSQEMVENGLLRKLLRRIDNMAAQLRKGNNPLRSTMTMGTYDGDDKSLWRELRRDLLRKGFRGRDIKCYSIALQIYWRKLQRDGMLGQVAPELSQPA
jgi:hypothetical protein